MKSGLDTMPLFLLDDLLRIKTDRQNNRKSSSVHSATVGAHGAYEVAEKLVQFFEGYKTLEHIDSSKKRVIIDCLWVSQVLKLQLKDFGIPLRS